MTEFNLIFFLSNVIVCIFAWATPRKIQLDVVALLTLSFICFYSPISAIWISLICFLNYIVICYSNKLSPTARVSVIITFSLLYFIILTTYDFTSNRYQLPTLLGISYYTCRNIHLLIEAIKGNMAGVSLRKVFQYNLFLPVLVVGPIHRFHNFNRQVERRKFDGNAIMPAIERILYGYAKIIIIGNWIINTKLNILITAIEPHGLLFDILISLKSWLYLYFAFSGATDVALGFAKLLGIKLEENFNQPWKAVNLIDFWQRWHISLSSWCKDYIFAPIQALTRNQLLAVTLSMVVMGLWHEASVYYILWGAYHAFGLFLCRAYQAANDPLKLSYLPLIARTTVTRIATFGWIIACMPLLNYLLN